MALNLKDLAKKPAAGRKTEPGAVGQAKTTARPWEVESWEQPAAPAAGGRYRCTMTLQTAWACA